MTESTALVELERRFDQYVDATGDCWLWLGALDRDGYGQVSVSSRTRRAHRWVWTVLVGEIPKGLVIDHLCRVKSCVNPDHMEPVTRAENVMRGYGPPAKHARQSHCNRGHPLSGDNLYQARGRRYCRACF